MSELVQEAPPLYLVDGRFDGADSYVVIVSKLTIMCWSGCFKLIHQGPSIGCIARVAHR
jgi:hypothetical protein